MCGSSEKMMINHKHNSGGEATMTPIQGLREFVSERLTSAAEEIFRVFQQTVVEYEKEIVRQRRLLDIVWKPEIKLHRTELPLQHVCRKKEVLTDQQLCDQETNSSLDQEDPQTPTAAAEEIPRVPQNIILDFNEDIHYQRRLLDLVWKPEIKLHSTELPQQHICKEEEEVLSDQDKNSTLDQEDPQTPTGAAEEIPRVTQNIILEFNEDINYQRRLLDLVWKPEIKLHSTEVPQQHVCKVEEVDSDQDKNSSLDPEDPEPPQIKEEQERLCTSQEGEQLSLKQMTDAVMFTPTNEIDHCGEEPKSDQLLSHNSPVAESQDQRGINDVDPGSTRDEESKNKKRERTLHDSKSHSDNVDNYFPTKRHRNTHTDKKCSTCEICGESFKFKSKLVVHMRIHTGEKLFSCEICGKRFSQKMQAVQHKRVHTGEKPYLCKTCGKGFKQPAQLNYHMSVHSDERLYSCETCGKKFKTKRVILDHMRIHTGEKPYSCKICGKGFRRRNLLKCHMMSHTGEKPYPCNNCGKAFKTRWALKVHMRIHTGEKPYVCKTCGEGFKQIAAVNYHMRVCSGERLYSCETCGKRFKTKSVMLDHMRTHTSEKPYSCNNCGKAFKTRRVLKVHMRIHTGERPYLCKTCGKGFKQISGLNYHMRVCSD